MREVESNYPPTSNASSRAAPARRKLGLVLVTLSAVGAIVSLTLLSMVGGAIAAGRAGPGLLVLSPLPLILLVVSILGGWVGVTSRGRSSVTGDPGP